MKRVGLLVVFSFFSFLLSAQKNKQSLANQYYNSGEYEKAAGIYSDLYEQGSRNFYYFNKYIDCLLALEEFDKASEEIRSEIKLRPKEIQLYTTLGNMLERQGKDDEAEKEYIRAIEAAEGNTAGISKLGSSFVTLKKYDLAIEVYKKGMEIPSPRDMFSYNIADTYRRKGDIKNAITYYIQNLKTNPKNILSLKNTMSRVLDDEGREELKIQLYDQIQSHPENNQFPELLQWIFEQERDYDKALRQARSIDRRMEENGKRVFDISEAARIDKSYDAAVKGYQYIIDTKGQNSSYYFESKKNMLLARKNAIVQDYDYTKADFAPLVNEYDSFLLEFGRNTQTAWLMMDYSRLQATYLEDLDAAIGLLEELKELKGINKYTRANAKISLADYYLMSGEIWESTLLYSQVDKEFKEELLGEKARYRNAMLSYYNGDFEWAQEQFDILKAATSKLISNDAIDMAVFIMDNMGLDTTDVPLRMFAQADLFIFQNQYDKAFVKLDSVITVFPKHGLEDDILFKKGQIYTKQKKYDQAVTAYQSIIDNHKEEIRCDNAIFELALLYENQLEDLEKAEALYKKLFIDFSNSTLAVDARKKYRLLRGDDVQ